MTIYGSAGAYVIRDKNDRFPVHFIFDTLVAAIDFAIKAYSKNDPNEYLHEWIDENEDDDGNYPNLHWEYLHENYTSEISSDATEIIFRNDSDDFVICPLDIYEITKEQLNQYGKELSYQDLWKLLSSTNPAVAQVSSTNADASGV